MHKSKFYSFYVWVEAEGSHIWPQPLGFHCRGRRPPILSYTALWGITPWLPSRSSESQLQNVLKSSGCAAVVTPQAMATPQSLNLRDLVFSQKLLSSLSSLLSLTVQNQRFLRLAFLAANSLPQLLYFRPPPAHLSRLFHISSYHFGVGVHHHYLFRESLSFLKLQKQISKWLKYVNYVTLNLKEQTNLSY